MNPIASPTISKPPQGTDLTEKASDSTVRTDSRHLAFRRIL